MTTQPFHYVLSFSAFVRIACFATLPITASAQTWDGGSGTNVNWSTAANWNPDVVPQNDGTANIVLGGAPQHSNVDLPWSVNSVRFPGTSSLTNFTVLGATLTIGPGGVTLNNPQANTVLFGGFSNPIVLNGSQSWSINAGSNDATFQANNLALGSNTLALRPAVGDMHMKGKITGSGGLIIGRSVFLHPAGSDYSGGTTVESAGTLAGFPTSIRGNITINPSGTVRFVSFLDSNIDNNANKDGTFRGAISGGGTINIGARIGFDPADSTVIGADIFLTHSLEAAAPGSLSFGGLRINGNTTLNMGNGANTVSFANSFGDASKPKYIWSGTLTITNYQAGTDTLRFGTSNLGLSSGQLGQIVFTDYGNAPGQIDANGFVTPNTAPPPAPPVITSPTAADTVAGQPFIYQIVATNQPTSYQAGNLPAGLTFDSALGVISGAPTNAGTYQLFIGAMNPAGSTSKMLTVTVQSPPPAGGPVIVSAAVTGRTGQTFGYQVVATGVTSAARVSATGLPSGLTIDSASGYISGTPQADGSYAVTLTLTDGTATAKGSIQLTFTSDAVFPLITSPNAVTVTPNEPFTYTITTPLGADSSDPVRYSIIGALPAGLTFNSSTGTISGTYDGAALTKSMRATVRSGEELLSAASGSIITTVQIFARNSHGTATTTLSFVTGTANLVGNVSTRLPVGTDDNVLIEGFIVQGPFGSSKKIMVRAIGPSLFSFGIADALANPTLEIHDASNATVATNNDWKNTQLGGLITSDQFAEIGASGLAPGNDLESAIIANLTPGSYTAIVRGLGNTIGTGVVDAYDLSAASPARLANIATRGLIQPGDKLMIAGFIVQNGPVDVVIRAIGPSLINFGIANALGDTTLQLKDQNGTIVLENDNWQTDQKQELENTGLQPSHQLEAAVVTTIQPGQYTAQVRGKGDTTGIGVVQVYFLQ